VLQGLYVGQEVRLLNGQHCLATLQLRGDLLFDLSSFGLASPQGSRCGVVIVGSNTEDLLAHRCGSGLLRRRLLLLLLRWVLLWQLLLMLVVRLVIPPSVLLVLCGRCNGRIIHALLVALRSVILVPVVSSVFLWCSGTRSQGEAGAFPEAAAGDSSWRVQTCMAGGSTSAAGAVCTQAVSPRG